MARVPVLLFSEISPTTARVGSQKDNNFGQGSQLISINLLAFRY
jgi:hypothetical protein